MSGMSTLRQKGIGRAGRTALVAAVAAVAMLAAPGCTRKSERLLFNGAYYPTKARAADKSDRTLFTVSVRRADQGLPGAREAGRHGAKEYCLQNFGTSEIAWSVGPDASDAALTGGGKGVVLSGKCVLW